MFIRIATAAAALVLIGNVAHAQTARPNDAQIAHIAYTAGQIDIANAEQAIDALPDVYRIVVVARVIEEMSVEETAQLFELNPETVKTRLHRARALLRQDMEQKFGPLLTQTFPFGGARCDRMAARVLERLGL